LTLSQFIIISYLWSHCISLHSVNEMTGIEPGTLVDWFKFLRNVFVCIQWLLVVLDTLSKLTKALFNVENTMLVVQCEIVGSLVVWIPLRRWDFGFC
jgi:hypothetical protein